MKRVKGFTLIELLIVVAIIAILAAIAVPNFLEAQVRSQVARCKADMRSIAVAFESYAVDNNRIPIGYNEGDTRAYGFGIWPQGQGANYAWQYLTSPVAYLSTVPLDPFTRGLSRSSDYFEYQTYISYPSGSTGWAARQLGFTYHLRGVGPDRRTGSNESGQAVYFYDIARRLASPGGSDPLEVIYDSTNGTRSFGDIYYSNKGFVDGTMF